MSTNTQQGQITLNDLKPLTTAYNTAVQQNQVRFEYNGMQFMTSYAKYLIEHLNNINHLKK